MNTIRTGIDLVEIRRLSDLDPLIRHRFLQRVFTPRELKEAGDSDARLAARFSAKEAVVKALGCGIGPVSWQEIEINTGSLGEPVLHLHGKALEIANSLGLEQWSISLTHSRDLAAAVAIAVGQYPPGNMQQ